MNISMEKVKAKKSLGQNFLRDENVIREILGIAEVRPEDHVLEIGPGTGALTEALAGTGARVVAIELDHRLIEGLRKKFEQSGNVTIVEGDILKINVPELLSRDFFSPTPSSRGLDTPPLAGGEEDRGAGGREEGGYKIIANIPYYITAPIIRTLLSLEHQPQSLTLMVQDEVAERLAAKAGDMSLLSIMAQYYATVEKKFFVPKEAFDPVPKVDSAVVQIVPKRAFSPEEDRKIFRLARAGFAARRKTLANNLSSSFSLSREAVEEKLRTLGLRPDARAQALSAEDWERLSAIW